MEPLARLSLLPACGIVGAVCLASLPAALVRASDVPPAGASGAGSPEPALVMEPVVEPPPPPPSPPGSAPAPASPPVVYVATAPAPAPPADPAAMTRIEDAFMALRLDVALSFGLGGEATFGGTSDTSTTSALLATWGVSGALELPLHTYVVAGADAALGWWNTEDLDDIDIGRSFLMDLGAHLYLRLPIARSAGYTDLFAGPRIALSVLDFNTDLEDQGSTALASDVTLGAATGVAYGVGVGVRYLGASGIGVVGRLGWTARSTTYTVDTDFGSTDNDLEMGQLTLDLGLSFGI